HTRSDRDWSSDVCSSDLPRASRPRGRTWLVAPLLRGSWLSVRRGLPADSEYLFAPARPHVRFPRQPSPQADDAPRLELTAPVARSEERRVGKGRGERGSR